MQISVCKLTTELLDDWLSYFDKNAFSDNDEWCGCYCMCYHWDVDLQKKRVWNCNKDCAEFNRQQAIDFIKKVASGGSKVYGGFGISKGEQSKALAPYVEAVVAGSVFVRTISANAGDKAALFDAVKAKAQELTGGN